MKTHFRFKIYSFVLFAVFLFSCSTVKTSSLGNELKINASPSPTPTNSPQKYEAKFINEKGWEIPLPEQRKKARTIERDVKSENGKSVKRILTIYIPKDDFFFHRDHSTSNLGNQMTTGLLQLDSIYELKVKENIYSYTVTARKAMTDEQKNKSMEQAHSFIYRYFDIDGDGKFETLVADDSDILVPAWVTQ